MPITVLRILQCNIFTNSIIHGIHLISFHENITLHLIVEERSTTSTANGLSSNDQLFLICPRHTGDWDCDEGADGDGDGDDGGSGADGDGD